MESRVLIVGAGPTGLMMACQLNRFGVPFRIIDKKDAPVQTTNAAGIQARSMEIFEQLGISERFLQKGVKANFFEIYSKKTKLASINFDQIDSIYQFVLMLPQSETEKILIEYLSENSINVERSTELINLEIVDGKYIATIKNPEGLTEKIEYDWVLGCDGFHSIVRDKAGIIMEGSEVKDEFLVADVRIKSDLTPKAVVVMLKRGTIIGLFPIPDDKYRIAANYKTSEFKKTISEEEVKNIVSDRTSGMCEVTEVIWSSPFWIHSRIANSLSKGSVYIAGDAAHVHSPAGAQGMNTGIQDATNLAWKLALVILYQANPETLDSYMIERYPAIESVVKVTEVAASLAISNSSFLYAIRNFFIKNVTGKIKLLQQKLSARIAQISIYYANSPIINYDKDGYNGPYKPGCRLPDVSFANSSVYDCIHNSQHNLLLFTGPHPTEYSIAMINNAYQWITQNKSDLIKPLVISMDPSFDLPNMLFDHDQIIHEHYMVDRPSMCLVRPDLYIGLFMGRITIDEIESYLEQFGL